MSFPETAARQPGGLFEAVFEELVPFSPSNSSEFSRTFRVRNQSRRFLALFLLLPAESVSARAAGAKKFRREAEKVLPAVIRDVSERGGLWVLAADLLVHAVDNRFLFERFAPPYEAGALLWVSPVPDGAATRILVGAQNGVFLAPHAPSERWTLIQSGLPSAASEPPLVLENGVVIPGKAGGLYFSSDAGKSWSRLDAAAEEGRFSGFAPDGRGGFYAGSLSEGVLHWSASTGNHN